MNLFTSTKPQIGQEGPQLSRGLEKLIPHALDTFGEDLLTYREQEIASLVVLGLDNKTISGRLEISVATVKVHRKNIYAKLEISSMGEIFQLFLNHLICCSYRPLRVA